jgi:hypothetical protein
MAGCRMKADGHTARTTANTCLSSKDFGAGWCDPEPEAGHRIEEEPVAPVSFE